MTQNIPINNKKMRWWGKIWIQFHFKLNLRINDILNIIQIQAVNEIFEGPEEYVAVGLEKFRPLPKAHLDLSNKSHQPIERACIHHGPKSLQQRSPRSKPTKPRDESVKSTKGRMRSPSYESKREDPIKIKEKSGRLRSSHSLFQFPSNRSRHHIPGI